MATTVTWGPTKDVALGGKAAGVIVQGVLDKQPPSNKQITVALDSMQETIKRQQYSGQYGKRAATDLQDIILTTKKLLEEKNSNDLLQQLFAHIHQARMQAAANAKPAQAKLTKTPSGSKGPVEKASQVLEAAKASTKLKGKEAKAMAEKTASKSSLRGSKAEKEKAKAKIDKKAAKVENESEVFKSLKVLVKSLANSSEFRGILVNMLELAKGTAMAASERVKKHNPSQLFDPLTKTAQKNMDGVLESKPPADPALARTTSVDNIGEAKQIKNEFRGAALETKSRVQSFGKEMKDEFFKNGPKDLPVDQTKLEELKTRFNRMLTEVLNKPDLAIAMKAIMDVIDERWKSVKITERTQTASTYMQSTAVSSKPKTPKMLTIGDEIWMDVRLLISQWTGTKELDRFLADSIDVMNVVSQDKDAVRFMRDLRKYIDQAIKTPAIMQTEKFQQKPAQFFDRMVDLLTRFKDNDKINSVIRQAKSLLTSMQTDQTTLKLRQALSKFAEDSIMADGRINFLVAKEVLTDMAGLLQPLLADQFATIPLPSVTITNPMIDATVSGVTISSLKLLPEHFNIKAEENVNFNLKSNHHHQNNVFATVRLQIRNTELDLKRVHFTVNKKQGFPKLREEGDVDVYAGGPDTKLTLKWQVYMDKNRVHFQTTKVKVHLDKFKVKFSHLRYHSIMLPMALGLAGGTIKKKIEQAITEQLYEKLGAVNKKLDDIVYQAQQKLRTLPSRMNASLQRASDQANISRANAQKNMRRARKQMNGYRERAAGVAKGAYKPFLENRGKPLSERAQLAAGNVKADVQAARPKKRSTRKSGSKRSTKTISTKDVRPTIVTRAVTGDKKILPEKTISYNDLKLTDSPSRKRRVNESSGSSSSSVDDSGSSVSTSSSAADEVQNVVVVPRELPAQLAAQQTTTTASATVTPPDNFLPLQHSDKIRAGEELSRAVAGESRPLATDLSGMPAKTSALNLTSSADYLSAH